MFCPLVTEKRYIRRIFLQENDYQYRIRFITRTIEGNRLDTNQKYLGGQANKRVG